MNTSGNHTVQTDLNSPSLALWRIQRARQNEHAQNVHRQLAQRQHDERVN